MPLCLPALVLLPSCARSQRLTALYCRALYLCRGHRHKCVDSPANRPHTGPVNIDSSGANTPWPAFPNQRARHSAQGTWGEPRFLYVRESWRLQESFLGLSFWSESSERVAVIQGVCIVQQTPREAAHRRRGDDWVRTRYVRVCRRSGDACTGCQPQHQGR